MVFPKRLWKRSTMSEKTASVHQEKLATDHSVDEPLTYEQAEAVLQNLAFDSRPIHPGPSRPSFVPEKPRPLEHVPEVFPGTNERPSFAAPCWTEKSFWSLFEAAPDGIVVID